MTKTLSKGILWFDSNKNTSLVEKYSKAALYYFDEYHILPNICFVNSCMLEGETVPAYLEILEYNNVLPDYLWIGLKT
jgi:hypothetical protein